MDGGVLFRLAYTIANGVVSGVDFGNSEDHLEGDHRVTLDAPLLTSEATVLHRWEFLFLEVDFSMEMYISSASPSSIPGIYPVILNADDSTLFQAYHSSGIGGDLPVATVNIPDCVVGVEDVSFGSVKSLFR